MKLLLILLCISTGYATTNVNDMYMKLEKHYQGKKTVQKLNKIIYIKRSKAMPPENKGCWRTRSKDPFWVCAMPLGYSDRYCYLQNVVGSIEGIRCKAYDDEVAKIKRYGKVDVYISEDI